MSDQTENLKSGQDQIQPTGRTLDSTGKKERLKKYMFLRVGQNTFALPLSVVREVLGLGNISSLPNMPAYFAGLINLRGKIISAVHLNKSLSSIVKNEAKDSVRKRPCVIITEVSGRMFGAIVDDVLEVSAISDSAIDHAVNGLEAESVFQGIIKREGSDLAPILNLEKALKVNELIAMTNRQVS